MFLIIKCPPSRNTLLPFCKAIVHFLQSVPMEPHDDGDDREEAEDFDPTEVFTVEDFLAEDEIMDEFIREIGDELKADIERESTTPRRRRRQSGPRRYCH